MLGKLFPNNTQTPESLKKVIFYKGKGCKECNETGYLGRIGIFETINVSPSISKMILERATKRAIEEQAVKEGLITLQQDGYLKVLAGLTTMEEVLRVAQE